MIRGVRGATTITEDRSHLIEEATAALAIEMSARNQIAPEDVISIFISTTTDISSSFPAKAIRSLPGWNYVPVMCMHEMNVKDSLPKCIRIMMHINTEKEQKEIEHVFLNEAISLRPDLVKK